MHGTVMSNFMPSLSINKNSQPIAKTKPKVRIIRIFAPEIIKTDVENFRELVQRLTGKPSPEKHGQKMPPPASASAAASRHQATVRSNFSLTSNKPKLGMKAEEEEEVEVGLCRVKNTSPGGYLGGFSDLEGFVSDFAQIPGSLPFDGTQIQCYEQLQF